MGLDEAGEGGVRDGGGRAGVAGDGVKRGACAGGGGGDGGGDAVAEGLVQERRQLRVDSEDAFVLEFADFEVKTFDLAVELARTRFNETGEPGGENFRDLQEHQLCRLGQLFLLG